MIVTEADLRDQLRRPTPGAQVAIPADARLSPAAADFVRHWSLVVVEQEGAGPPGPIRPTTAAEWDRAATFPVDRSGEAPCCVTCGTPLDAKPGALTQLNAHHFAPKTHPRIRLRGSIDALHALVLLIQGVALRSGRLALADDLGTVAAYCRELASAEYNERPAAQPRLRDWDADAIHRATHDPRGELGIDHLALGADAPELQHWLGVARTQARQLEIVALETYPSPHHRSGASIAHGCNRLSSLLYFLQLRLARGEG